MPLHKTLFRYAAPALLALAALLATGCSRSVTTTTVKADGSFTRTIVFHGPKPADPGAAGGAPPGMGMGGELADSFDMPSGGPWKTKREKLESEEVYTAERELTPGTVQKKDIAIKSGDKSKPGVFMVNEASVRSVGPGKWEYRETLHWSGKVPDVTNTIPPEMLQAIKSALPPALATDANVRPISVALTHELWRMLFGPGDPLISSWSQFMMQPEAIERKMSARMGAGLDKAIAAQLGDKLTPEQRRACVQKLIRSTTAMLNSKTSKNADPTKAGGSTDLGDGALAAMTFTVKMPGKIVSTNGERDDFANQVSWSVYPQAAEIGDVEMTAVCDTKTP